MDILIIVIAVCWLGYYVIKWLNKDSEREQSSRNSQARGSSLGTQNEKTTYRPTDNRNNSNIVFGNSAQSDKQKKKHTAKRI